MGNFVAGAAADHAGCAKAMKEREKARDTVCLVKSIVAIGFYWSVKHAE